MEQNSQFHIKIKYFTWKSYILIIREKDFQLLKEKSNKKKLKTYSIINTVILDKSDKSSAKISITSPLYNFLIKINKPEEKQVIISKFEEIIKKNSEKTAFSKFYLDYLKQLPNQEIKSPSEEILLKFKTYTLLIREINTQLSRFKKLVKEKLPSSISGDFLSMHNDINTIATEMKRQFKKIEKRIKKNFLKIEDKTQNEKEKDSSSSSSYDEKINWNIKEETESNINANNKINNININPKEPYFCNS